MPTQRISTQGMKIGQFFPRGIPVFITPIIDIKGPERILVNLERRLSQTELMWFLRTVVSPFMADVIVDRFAYAGDATVGMWPSLADYTEKLKRTLGAPSNAPNERTGDLLYHLAYEHAVEPWVGGAQLRIPGNSDDLEKKKIRTAQEGEPASANPFGGATPPRPVLGWGEREEQALTIMFNLYLWSGL